MPDLEARVVLGRVLHGLLSGLLTWQGEVQAFALSLGGVAIFGQTICRFPEVLRARRAIDSLTGRLKVWSRGIDQWQRGFAAREGLLKLS